MALVEKRQDIIQTGMYNEIEVEYFPKRKRWMRSIFRTVFFYFREMLFARYNIRNLLRQADSFNLSVLHIVNHGKYNAEMCCWALKKNIEVWASFHDHFLPSGSTFTAAKKLWQCSSRRFVISTEMGQLYQNIFGFKSYQVLTDGLKEDEIYAPKKIDLLSVNHFTVYFAGLVHIDYYPLFDKFIQALSAFCLEKKLKVKFILRGTHRLPFNSNSWVQIEYKPFSLDNNELTNDIKNADVLYLPINFNDSNFYKYSLSTKMIGYLGSSGNIFYHGPKDSAAANLLRDYSAAVLCDTNEISSICESLSKIISTDIFSNNAKRLAIERFSLKNMQSMFFKIGI